MAELHNTLMGRKLLEVIIPDIAINLERIADALEQQAYIMNPKDKIEIEVCYYEDENGKKVYDFEHMQDQFEEKLKELES
jgi:hypothetical protein